MSKRLLFASVVAVAIAGVRPADAHPSHRSLVYVESNDADVNELLVFRPTGGGSLEPAFRVPTGGRGTGAGLGSQGAVSISEDGSWLVAVNAGSDEVSLFHIGARGRPILFDVAPSGGPMPISVAIRDGLVYVVNSDSVVGMEVAWHGGLSPIDSARQPLSAAGAGPAQISFAPDGRALFVTEKMTGCIDEFPLDRRDRARPLTCHPSAGETPFGFAFLDDDDRRDEDAATLIVSEAFGGAAGASAVSSYRSDDGRLQAVTASAPTTQTAACWIALTPDGRFAYTTNTGSGTVTGFRIGRRGALGRIDAGVTGVTGGAPIDAAVIDDHLHVLTSSAIVTFAVAADGSLRKTGELGGLPAAAVGLAVR